MTPVKVTTDERRQARLAGFRKKKPKKPKSRTVNAMENYISRYNDWAKELKSKAKEGKKIEDLRKKVSSC
jgi:ADP-glucose pyrophosphorylase